MRAAASWVTERLYDGWTAAHVCLSLVPLWLCVILLLPPSTFESSPSYGYFEELIPGPHSEEIWAAIFLVISCLGFLGVIWRDGLVGHGSRSLLCLAHLEIAWCFFHGNPAGTGPGTYALWATLGLGIFVQGMRPAHGAIHR